MTMKCSTGLRNQMLDTNPFRTIFNLGFIKIYDGPVPATADAVLDAANHLLVTISNNSTGTGITFEAAAVDGQIAKKSSETWSGLGGATGTASFFRLVAVGDTGVASTTQARVQGVCALTGQDLDMSSLTVTSGVTTVPVDSFSMTLPTL
jgi:hypothetical protein